MALSLLFYCISCKEARLLTGSVQKSYKFIRNIAFHHTAAVFFIWFSTLPEPYVFRGKTQLSSFETKETLPYDYD